METETTPQHDKVEQGRKRKAGNSKAYRKRKKRLIDQTANLKAWRDKKKLEKYAAEEARILQNQRARDKNTNYDGIVQFVSQQSGDNDQMQQRSTRIVNFYEKQDGDREQ
ncbi:hypothetical protein PV328_011963 [Microctonus aethiopoides]|uniref:Uncharacterized protein n=1 Tax=Microctonus aethiopoides TaxID=144406 RepID=A0AA39EUE0_9HYME|nr:hypothetical protein PV328_011963 [Microctonus aethiopoides]